MLEIVVLTIDECVIAIDMKAHTTHENKEHSIFVTSNACVIIIIIDIFFSLPFFFLFSFVHLRCTWQRKQELRIPTRIYTYKFFSPSYFLSYTCRVPFSSSSLAIPCFSDDILNDNTILFSIGRKQWQRTINSINIYIYTPER